MISFSSAIELLQRGADLVPEKKVETKKSAGFFLRQKQYATHDHPFFAQSAVDGYAIRFNDLSRFDELEVAGELAAGTFSSFASKPGSAIRIFTGAKVPSAFDTVVMQEHCSRSGKMIRFQKTPIKGANIRKRGEQLKKGQQIFSEGTLLSPAAIGLLIGIGISNVVVSSKPKVHILTTGSEFAESNEELSNGKIFESNGDMISNALLAERLEFTNSSCTDDLKKLKKSIQSGLAGVELILITGGVSVGDYDFTRPALEDLGFDIIFHRVAQKPGKPILFARKGNQYAFGLPGNPRSALICYYMYVLPFIHMLQGAFRVGLPTVSVPLKHDYEKKGGLCLFLSATLSEENLTFAQAQGSHMLQNMAYANCIAVLPEEEKTYKKGELIKCLLLPNR